MLFPSVNRQKTWLLALLILIISLNLYFSFKFDSLERRVSWIESIFKAVLFPVHWVVDTSHGGLEAVGFYTTRIFSAVKENEKLKAELQSAQLELQRFSELQIELKRLEALLGFQRDQKIPLMAGRIIARDPHPYFRSIQIDRGERDGLVPDMAVVSPQGVVGRILKLGNSSSTVLLLTDVNSRIDSINERSRNRVIVGGSPQGDLKLRYLARRSDLKQGDMLITSGLGGFFPSGFSVGLVVGIGRDPHFVLEEAEVEPSVDIDSLEEVFIVNQKPKSWQ